MLTSSFTGKQNYMRPFGELTKDAEAMKQFGGSVIVWDFHARKPLQILSVPGVPLELRWALLPNHNYAFTSTALTGQLVLISSTSRTTARGRARTSRRSGPTCPSISASLPTTARSTSTPSATAPCASTTSRTRSRASWWSR
jgi:hypothetical protein